MRILISVLASAIAGTALLPAQSSFTTPAGVETSEGTESFLMFNERRLQGLDNTIPGPIANIDSIAFRRDGLSTSTAGAPRTLDVQVVMGVGDFAARTSNFQSNFASSTVVVATRNVNFPDWIAVPAVPPAPFDFVIPFDQPWSYPGGQALIWDVTATNGSVTRSVPMDRHGWSSTGGDSGEILGTGCIATGATTEYSHYLTLYNSGPLGDMRMRWSGFNAPAGAATVLHLDFFDADLPFPGLCANLHSLGGLLTIATPTPSGTGSIASTTATFAYSAGLVGLPIVSQLLSLDPGQPGLGIALSHGREVLMPPYLEVAYVWGGAASATGSLIAAGTLPVARFTH